MRTSRVLCFVVKFFLKLLKTPFACFLLFNLQIYIMTLGTNLITMPHLVSVLYSYYIFIADNF